MRIILPLLRIFLGAVFIFSAVSKLFPLEVFELNFVYQGISGWELAPYLARGVIIFELFLGLALLFNNLLKQLILPATIALLTLFTIYLCISIAKDGNNGNCACFGTVLPMTPLESILKNCILLLVCSFIYFKIPSLPWRFKWLLPSLFLISATTIVLLFPIYVYPSKAKDSKNELSEIANLVGFETEPKADLKAGKKLVAVFNMACHHCVEVALKLSAAASRTKFPPTYFVLLGERSEVQPFYELTHSKAPFLLMKAEDFIKQYKTGWPRVLLLEDGIIKYDNDYRTFNGGDFEKRVIKFLAQ